MYCLATTLLLLVTSPSLHALSSAQAEEIAQRIWKNECNHSIDGLVSWNAGEEFASLGIGHFIWYPAGKRGPFKETFPALVQFLQENRVAVPQWVRTAAACPWRSTKEFLASTQDPQVQELKQLLVETVSLQTQFLIRRFEQTESYLTESLPQERKRHVLKQLERLKEAPNGYYALIDYLNFKGDGTDPEERYHNQGWGLLQVLECMPGTTSDPVREFIAQGKAVLTQRVKNSPPERNEKRWLLGWFHRLDTYHAESPHLKN